MKRALAIILFFLALLSGPLYLLLTGSVHLGSNWRVANRQSAGIAPKASDYQPALIQIYAAHAYNWRGLFAVHTWLALKPAHADHYRIFQVTLWRLWQGKSAVSETTGPPDRYWFGNRPTLIRSISGPKAQRLIPQVLRAIDSYPYAWQYHAWPGPNSNTFTAYIGRQVPELDLVMPPNALGKDYLPARHFLVPVPSHSGYVFSLLGIYALSVSKQEGVQLTILGLNYGFTWSPFRLIWPAVGYLW